MSGECLLSTGPTSDASKERQERETHTVPLAVGLQWGCLALRDVWFGSGSFDPRTSGRCDLCLYVPTVLHLVAALQSFSRGLKCRHEHWVRGTRPQARGLQLRAPPLNASRGTSWNLQARTGQDLVISITSLKCSFQSPKHEEKQLASIVEMINS